MGKQKRSENTYTKINTIFLRDENNIIMPYDEFVAPEFEWLRNCKFDADEKIDGTNIRIEVTRQVEDNSITWSVEFKGKTDKATIPPKLDKYLKETFTEDKVLSSLGLSKNMVILDENGNATQEMKDKKWVKIDNGELTNEFDISRVPEMYTFYGEGYGTGIQSGGYYREDVAFIGFDVKVDDMYLLRAQRDEIFNKLGADIVPYIGQFTIDEAIEFLRTEVNK